MTLMFSHPSSGLVNVLGTFWYRVTSDIGSHCPRRLSGFGSRRLPHAECRKQESAAAWHRRVLKHNLIPTVEYRHERFSTSRSIFIMVTCAAGVTVILSPSSSAEEHSIREQTWAKAPGGVSWHRPPCCFARWRRCQMGAGLH